MPMHIITTINYPNVRDVPNNGQIEDKNLGKIPKISKKFVKSKNWIQNWILGKRSQNA